MPLVNHNAICCRSGDECDAVGDLGGGGGVVKGEVGQEVPGNGKQQGQVAAGRSAMALRKRNQKPRCQDLAKLTQQTSQICSNKKKWLVAERDQREKVWRTGLL